MNTYKIIVYEHQATGKLKRISEYLRDPETHKFFTRSGAQKFAKHLFAHEYDQERYEIYVEPADPMTSSLVGSITRDYAKPRPKKPECVKRYRRLNPGMTKHEALRMCKMVGMPIKYSQKPPKVSDGAVFVSDWPALFDSPNLRACIGTKAVKDLEKIGIIERESGFGYHVVKKPSFFTRANLGAKIYESLLSCAGVQKTRATEKMQQEELEKHRKEEWENRKRKQEERLAVAIPEERQLMKKMQERDDVFGWRDGERRDLRLAELDKEIPMLEEAVKLKKGKLTIGWQPIGSYPEFINVADFMDSSRTKSRKSSGSHKLRRVGTSKTHKTCQACGKTGLKKTYVFETKSGKKYLGSECAKSSKKDHAEEKWFTYQDWIKDIEDRVVIHLVPIHISGPKVRKLFAEHKRKISEALLERWKAHEQPFSVALDISETLYPVAEAKAQHRLRLIHEFESPKPVPTKEGLCLEEMISSGIAKTQREAFFLCIQAQQAGIDPRELVKRIQRKQGKWLVPVGLGVGMLAGYGISKAAGVV